MPIQANKDLTFTLALKSGGDAIPIAPDATVSARLYAADGATPISNPVPASASTLGANWPQGLVVVDIPAAETALVTPPQACIILSVERGGTIRNWLTRVDVASSEAQNSALFNQAVAVAQFRAARLQQVQRYTGLAVSDERIWQQLLAAEGEAQRRLSVFLRPTALFPDQPTQAELDALAGAPWAIDPGYDMDQDLLQPGGWSYLALRQRPVLGIDSIRYVYPSMGTVFTLPSQWIKLDRKYGHVRFIPASSALATPLPSMVVGGLGLTGAPQFIEVRYRAGLQNPAQTYPELPELVQRLAMARMLVDAVLPASSSISADGLSQSKSPPDVDKLMANIDQSFDLLKTRLHGVQMVVL